MHFKINQTYLYFIVTYLYNILLMNERNLQNYT